MSQISGLTIERTKTGKVTKVTLSARRWGHLIEDILDRNYGWKKIKTRQK